MNRHNEEKMQTKTEVPVNTRAVGEPSGTYLLYLEDYVHTFVRKIYQENQNQNREGKVLLYGYEFEEQGKNYLIISGAMDKETIAVSGERFFPSSYCIGEAKVREGKNAQIALEVLLRNDRKLVVEDFYIYYDQNEEMQNYLIEWNLNHNKCRIRKEEEDSVRYGRIAQAHNREEVKVNYLWNVMNLLSFGLVVCVAAFGIISVNNYHKMKEMESKISYIMSLPSETLAVMNPQIEAAKNWYSSIEREEETEDSVQIYSTVQAQESSVQETMQTQQTYESETLEPETPESEPFEPEPNVPSTESVQTNTEPVRYYIVQQGDTLRSISYQIYGTYSRVPDICAWNAIEDADSILYGQKLLLHQE